MTRYQKIWLSFVSVFLFMVFGFLIQASFRSDDNATINRVLQSSDTTNVISIEIAPYNLDWNTNLTAEPVMLENKRDISDLLVSLRSLRKKHFTKGTAIKWNAYVVLIFDGGFKNNLKDQSQLVFHIYDSEEGLYAERQNVMGHTTYSSDDLKSKLEKLTNYQYPR
jgi:hypothetical protein